MALLPPQIVCFLDVLGFENILENLGLMALQAKYETLTEFVKKQTGGGIDIVPTPDGHVAVGWLVVNHAYFSDSLLFWTPYSRMSLPSFTQLISDVICLGLETGLPMRGAIAVGEVILDNDTSTFLGKPLVEVARVEKAQKWIGVSFGPSFKDPSYAGEYHLNTVLPYKSHYKDATDKLVTGITLDWPRHWRETRKSSPRPILKAFDIDPAFASYYDKSVEFIEFSESNHDWFRRQSNIDYG